MKRQWFGICALALLFSGAVRAQESGASVFPVDPIALLKHLLGPNAVFTATGQVSGEGPNDTDNFHMDTSYALLHDQLRTETDLGKLRSRNACDIAQGRLQEMGMDDTVMIILPELKMSYVVYPRAHAYIETPLTWRERLKEIFDVRKTDIGPDTVDGHPCLKSRLLVTNATGDETEVLVWAAIDLNRFPIQLHIDIGRASFNLLFQNVRLDQPDIALFEPPVEYDRYASLHELIRARRRLSESTE